MTLKLRDGWKTCETDHCIYIYAPEGLRFSAEWYVDMDPDTGIVYAYPDGGSDGFKFGTIEEAHAYLLSVGSESPWEEA